MLIFFMTTELFDNSFKTYFDSFGDKAIYLLKLLFSEKHFRGPSSDIYFYLKFKRFVIFLSCLNDQQLTILRELIVKKYNCTPKTFTRIYNTLQKYFGFKEPETNFEVLNLKLDKIENQLSLPKSYKRGSLSITNLQNLYDKRRALREALFELILSEYNLSIEEL